MILVSLLWFVSGVVVGGLSLAWVMPTVAPAVLRSMAKMDRCGPEERVAMCEIADDIEWLFSGTDQTEK